MVELTESEAFILALIFVLVVGINLAVMGMIKKNPGLLFMSGIVWIVGAVMIFTSLNVGLVIIGIGIGLFLMFEGGLTIYETDKA